MMFSTFLVEMGADTPPANIVQTWGQLTLQTRTRGPVSGMVGRNGKVLAYSDAIRCCLF
jgi:hypothetical protein